MRHACRRRPSLAVRTRRWPADRCRQQQHKVGTRTRAALERPLRLVFSRALPRRPPSAGRALDSSSLNTHTHENISKPKLFTLLACSRSLWPRKIKSSAPAQSGPSRFVVLARSLLYCFRFKRQNPACFPHTLHLQDEIFDNY